MRDQNFLAMLDWEGPWGGPWCQCSGLRVSDLLPHDAQVEPGISLPGLLSSVPFLYKAESSNSDKIPLEELLWSLGRQGANHAGLPLQFLIFKDILIGLFQVDI